MRVSVHKSNRSVNIWMSNIDSRNVEQKENLESIIAHYSYLNYYVVVYKSGTGDLYENTLQLLLHNRSAGNTQTN